MEIDSPPESFPVEPHDRVIQRLVLLGVPPAYLGALHQGLVSFVKENPSWVPKVVSSILPTDEEVAEGLREAKHRYKKITVGLSMKKHFRESMVWLRWLMFEDEPSVALMNLANMSVGQRGVCGAVWGYHDLAYRCRTCENDPTCAICVPCFLNGDHKDHDYSTIFTGGGCCDCGDETAWKREGFCSKHKGSEQIQPLPEKLANSVGPVLIALCICWKNKLNYDEIICENSRLTDQIAEKKKIANELTFGIVEMLLEFCKFSESLLSFVSKVITSVGLLDILVRAERFLIQAVVPKLHELLLKLLAEPIFKYEFAKVFVRYYPTVLNESVKENRDNVIKKYPLLSTFSVQIFTVPTLTPRLVKEMNLLTVLLQCLGDIFSSCVGGDGRLEATKWGSLFETTLRVIADIRFVMSHSVVSKYVTHEQQDILSHWMRLLAFVQGMNPLKRETGIHIEEENEATLLPFDLGHAIGHVHSLFVDGAFSVANEEAENEILFEVDDQDMDDRDSVRYAKVGRLSQESSDCSPKGRSTTFACVSKDAEDNTDASCHAVLPPSITWLIRECLRAMESWLRVGNGTSTALCITSSSDDSSGISNKNLLALKKTISRIKRGNYIFSRLSGSSDDHGIDCTSPRRGDMQVSTDLENTRSTVQQTETTNTGNIDLVACYSTGGDENAMEADYAVESDDFRILGFSDWPNINYDVSSEDVCIHIPLHGLLSLLLQRALRMYFGESAVPNSTCASYASPLSANHTDFFRHVLKGCHPYGFSAFVMEHPLQIRVFCAEVTAGMWRKNGDAALASCEWYRSVRWSEQGLELDLFLLQCCAALAPPDDYVNRIVDRFGLSSYLSLGLKSSSEYEPTLVREMLTLIIQIVQERRFSGLTTAESLRRELVYRLAIGDATRSQLVKSLPRDLSKCGQLQEVLDVVAAYSDPSGFNQGMYTLRSCCWKELDMYHPRCNSRDLQVAEERYFRACGVSALSTQLPTWKRIFPPLKGLAGVATCKGTLQIIRAVLYYAVFTDKSSESRAPDNVLLIALHLLSLALDICLQQKEFSSQARCVGDSIPILAFASEEIVEGFKYGAGRHSLLSLLVTLMRKPKKDNLHNFLDAGNFNLSSLIESFLKKFAEMDSGCMAKLQELAPEVVDHLSQPVARRDVNLPSTSDSEKRKMKARERQAAILAKMKAEQSKFLSSVSSTMDDSLYSELEASNPGGGQGSEDVERDVCSLCHDPDSKDSVSFLILLQKSRLLSYRSPPSWEQVRKEKAVSTSGRATDPFAVRFSSRSSLASSSLQLTQPTATDDSANNGQNGDVNAILEFLKARFPSLRNMQTPNASSDVHTFEMLEKDLYLSICSNMHDDTRCGNFIRKKYVTSGAEVALESVTVGAQSDLLCNYIDILSREMSRNSSASENSHSDQVQADSVSQIVYDGFGPSDCDGIHLSSCGHAVHQGCLDLYLSSLKERYARRNVFEGAHIVDPDQGEFLCPVCRRLANSVLPAYPWDPTVDLLHSSDSSLTSNEETVSLQLQQALCLLQSSATVVGKGDILKAFALQRNERIRPDLESVSHVLSQLYFPKKNKKSVGFPRISQSIIMWDTLKYTLMSLEIAARCGKTSMVPTYGLDSLYQEFKSSSGFILSLLLKVIHSTRSKDSLHVLQRFRGIQLFAESICSGISVKFPCKASGEGGNIQNSLKSVHLEESSPDIQFWDRASDPILARDAFSSLMWVLFCLPCPFISCKKSLLSLVHCFYAVTVVQGVITCCLNDQDNVTELGLHDCLITDIMEFLRETGCSRMNCDSGDISPCNITDTLRRLCFPYLRRCALLWKLLQSSDPALYCDRDYDTSYHTISVMDSTDCVQSELIEVAKLEKMFEIPQIDFILKDGLLRSLALIWFRHSMKEFGSYTGVLNSCPAVPFRLMELPHLYQDLLQRYIKPSCPDCNSVINEPVLCLLCGRLCSPSWKSCCRESGCHSHAMACGAGIGVFLSIRRTDILLQRCARQAPWPSPYLDAFGEEDIEMRRGKPLYLNEERYAALSYMVASHGLDRSSKVLGRTTIGSFFIV